MITNQNRLVLLAALSCVSVPLFAVEPAARPQSVCKLPDYPERAQKAEEAGLTLIGFLIRADGTVGDTVTLNSSGSRRLDRAASLALSRCMFHGDVSQAASVWETVSYVWTFTDDPDMLGPKRTAALAAGKGKVSERYNLSLLIFATAKTDADRAQGLLVLRSAAELGHAHAQFDLGRRHENGEGVETNLEEALRWYGKAAAQGNPFAKQRLLIDKPHHRDVPRT